MRVLMISTRISLLSLLAVAALACSGEETLSNTCQESQRPSLIQQRTDLSAQPASALEIASNKTNQTENISQNQSGQSGPQIVIANQQQESASGMAGPGVAQAVAQAQAQAVAQAVGQAQADAEKLASGGPDDKYSVVVVTVPQFEHTKKSPATMGEAGAEVAVEGGEGAEKAEGEEGKEGEGEEMSTEEASERNKERYTEQEGGEGKKPAGAPPQTWLLLLLLLGPLICGCGSFFGFKFWKEKGSPTPSNAPANVRNIIERGSSFRQAPHAGFQGFGSESRQERVPSGDHYH
mmetsp:Transcript_34076/g.76046  ORF Transcript_34076/g.76046 Transcript_34076/m.76046 type:complete len:293 (-) Transcript_34076:135-1013(-)